jgi:hypothetical protein
MVRQFFLGFIKIHVLHHAAEGEVYGLALNAELRNGKVRKLRHDHARGRRGAHGCAPEDLWVAAQGKNWPLAQFYLTIFKPDGSGKYALVARVQVGQWATARR